MVVGTFPIAKLGALLLKQISKPIANAVKEQAKTSPIFKKYVCLPPAQLYNWFEEKAKMWILNLGKPVSVPVYNEKMAIELGANLLGEGIIFVIAAGILISEYNRSSRKETAKEEAKHQEMHQLQMSLRELFVQTEEQAAHIRELRRKLGEVDTQLTRSHLSGKSKGGDHQLLSPVSNHEILTSDIKEVVIKPMNMTPEISSCECIERYSSNENMLMQTIREIENEFWYYSPSERIPGRVSISLDYLYKNVYRIENISFV